MRKLEATDRSGQVDEETRPRALSSGGDGQAVTSRAGQRRQVEMPVEKIQMLAGVGRGIS